MTPKGILYSSMELEPGYFVDIYDLHADAVVKKCGLTYPWIKLIRNRNVPANGDALMDTTKRNGPNNEVVDKISSFASSDKSWQYKISM